MEWSKLYRNENNEHLPYEDFLALNESALTIPVTEWLYLGRNQPLIIPRQHFAESQSDDHNSKKQRVDPATSTAGVCMYVFMFVCMLAGNSRGCDHRKMLITLTCTNRGTKVVPLLGVLRKYPLPPCNNLYPPGFNPSGI